MTSQSKGQAREKQIDAANGFSDLVQRVHDGDPSGMEELYRMFSTGVRFYLCRQLGPQDLDDKVHDIFLIIAQSIQRGDLRDPDRLMGYVRTIVRRQVAAYIDRAVQSRRSHAELGFGMALSDQQPTPESRLIDHENTAVALGMLNSLHRRDREVLIRFYLHEQPAAEICREMGLTETQFRLIKSRAKARFGELGKRRMAQRKGFTSGGGA